MRRKGEFSELSLCFYPTKVTSVSKAVQFMQTSTLYCSWHAQACWGCQSEFHMARDETSCVVWEYIASPSACDGFSCEGNASGVEPLQDEASPSPPSLSVQLFGHPLSFFLMISTNVLYFYLVSAGRDCLRYCMTAWYQEFQLQFASQSWEYLKNSLIK